VNFIFAKRPHFTVVEDVKPERQNNANSLKHTIAVPCFFAVKQILVRDEHGVLLHCVVPRLAVGPTRMHFGLRPTFVCMLSEQFHQADVLRR